MCNVRHGLPSDAWRLCCSVKHAGLDGSGTCSAGSSGSNVERSVPKSTGVIKNIPRTCSAGTSSGIQAPAASTSFRAVYTPFPVVTRTPPSGVGCQLTRGSPSLPQGGRRK